VFWLNVWFMQCLPKYCTCFWGKTKKKKKKMDEEEHILLLPDDENNR
jgi:cbb3-type cytochrome oxidase subunit 3